MNIPKTFLTEAVDKTSILKILTQSKSGSTSDPHYKALAQWAVDKHRQSKIKNIELGTLQISDRSLIGHKLASRHNTLGSLLDALHNLMYQEGKYGENKELSSKIQKITLEILTSLKQGTKVEETKPEEESELYEGMDWTAEKSKRLTEARETGEAISSVLDKFSNDYYSVEYAGKTKSSEGDPNIVAKLKSLDKILIPEFNALGYNPEVNPLAQFLKLLIKHKPNIFNKLTTNTYGAIHNSFIDKNITGNMLGNYPENVGTENILFCNDLYNRSGLDMVEYLLLQKQFIDAAKGTEYADDSKFIAKMFIQQKTFDKNYEKNIVLLLKEHQVIDTLADSAKLKSIAEVRELYKHIFKTPAKKRVNVDQIVDKAKDKQVVLDMIQRILDQDEFERAYPAVAKKYKAQLAEIGYTRQDEKIEISKEILSEYKIDAKAAYSIIDKLIDTHDKLTKAKKAGADK